MGRQQEVNAGGSKRQRPIEDVEQTNDDVVRAQAAGFADLDFIITGDYFDLHEDEIWDISPTTDTFVKASVPPGNSYNNDHYASDTGPGSSVENATSELMAAVCQLEGDIEGAVDVKFTWYKPDGSVAWSNGSREELFDAPDEGYFYPDVDFWTFIGRDFSHGGTTEVDQLGTYTVEFDTNYGTYSETVEVIGPHLTTCDTPNTIQDGGSAEFGATIEKPIDDDNSYNGDVVVAREMTADYTTRDVIHREPFSISSVQDTKGVSFDVPASAFDQFGGLGSDTPIMMWAETYGF